MKSFKIKEAIAKSFRPFSDGEFIKDCIQMFVDKWAQKNSLKNTGLSHPTITRRIQHLSQDTENVLEMKTSQCEFYNFALDESTNISDSAQLSIFIRGVTNNFKVIEELLQMWSMKETTTGQHIVDEVKKVFETFKIDCKNVCGATTDGAAAITENKRFYYAFYGWIGN